MNDIESRNRHRVPQVEQAPLALTRRRRAASALTLVGLLGCAGGSLEETFEGEPLGETTQALTCGSIPMDERCSMGPSRPDKCSDCLVSDAVISRVEYDASTARIRLISSKQIDRVVAVGILPGSRGIVVSPTLVGVPSPARKSDGTFQVDLTTPLHRQLAGYALLQVYVEASNGTGETVAAPYVVL